MKFSEVALTVLIVLSVVIVVILLSSKNPETGLVAPLVVPVRTFFGYLGGRGGNGGDTHIHNKIKNQLKNTNQIKANPVKNLSKDNQKNKIEITSFQDLINLADKEKEIELKYDLERNVKLVSFNKGKIDISFNEKLNKNFIKILTEKLISWTGERWIISLSKNNNVKSIYEKRLENKHDIIENFKKSKLAQDIQKAFPDAKLIDLTEEE